MMLHLKIWLSWKAAVQDEPDDILGKPLNPGQEVQQGSYHLDCRNTALLQVSLICVSMWRSM